MKLAPSKATSFVQALAVIAFVVGVVACQPAPNGSALTPNTSAPTGHAPRAEGGSSGGGGYVSENSAILLEQTSQKLASMIRKSTPAIFGDLPQGWSAERLAKITANIRTSGDKEVRRDGKDLMFNYGVDSDGVEYVEALKPFFHIYGATPIKMQHAEQLRDLQNDLMLKILHEAAHLMKFSEKEAEAFAYDKMLEMDLDIYSCVASNDLLVEPGVAIRRSTGEAFRVDQNRWYFLTQPFTADGKPVTFPKPWTPDPRVFKKENFKIGDWERKAERYVKQSKSGFYAKLNTKQIGPQSMAIETKSFHPPSSEAGIYIESNTVEITFGSDPKSNYVTSAKATARMNQYYTDYNLDPNASTSKPKGDVFRSSGLVCKWRADYITTSSPSRSDDENPPEANIYQQNEYACVKGIISKRPNAMSTMISSSSAYNILFDLKTDGYIGMTDHPYFNTVAVAKGVTLLLSAEQTNEIEYAITHGNKSQKEIRIEACGAMGYPETSVEGGDQPAMVVKSTRDL